MQWVTLLTDWGAKDSYVAQVKAGIWRELPEAHIVDVTHDSPRGDIYSAAYMLANFLSCCPDGTIHIVGVNDIASTRNAHLVIKIRNQYVIGADNGFFALFTFLTGEKTERITEIDVYQTSSVFTFPARDLFVKVAGMIARGADSSEIGHDGAIKNTMMDGGFLRVVEEKDRQGAVTGLRLIGKILFVDGFGNAVTNITRQQFDECFKQFSGYTLVLRSREIPDARVVKAYPDVVEGEVAMIFLENGLMEISMNRGNCARMFALKRNDDVMVLFRPDPVRKLKVM